MTGSAGSEIVEVRVWAVPMETSHKYTMSNSTVATPVSTIVAVRDRDGVVGWGEVCMASPQFQAAHNDGIRASLEVLAPAVLGLDPMQLTVVNAAMRAALDGHAEGRAAIDIACWDLMGKRLGVSVVDLLGGARMERVITYHVIGIGTPDDAAAQAEQLQDEGHTRLQLKVGGRPVDLDIACMRAVAAVRRPGTDLAVDANRAWTVAEAMHASTACRDLPLSLEQPCATEAELADLAPRIPHPIVADESARDLPTIARLIASGTAGGFGLKLSRLGGLTPMRAVRDLCMAARVPMSSDDAWGGDIIAAAGVALGATLDPELSRGAWIAHPYHQTHWDDANGPRLESGHVTLPAAGPGLGLVIDEAQFGAPVSIHRR